MSGNPYAVGTDHQFVSHGAADAGTSAAVPVAATTASMAQSAVTASSTDAAAPLSSGGVSGKSLVLQRRVKELVAMPVNGELKELIHYLEAITPAPTATTATTNTASSATSGPAPAHPPTDRSSGGAVLALAPGTVARKPVAVTSTNSEVVAAATTPTVTNTAVPATPQALHSVLEARATSIHRDYLGHFATLYEAFKSASSSVEQVHQHATSLSHVVSAQAAKSESLVLQLATLQAELQMVQQRSEAVREFKQKFLFGAEEQRVLEKDPITPAYLDVVDRAREVHRKSRHLLAAHGADLSPGLAAEEVARTTNAAATAVMESTYAAVVHATMRIARHVNTALSASAATSPAVWSSSATHGAAATSSSSSARGVAPATSSTHTVMSDEPDIGSFLLRCLALLRQEDVPQWEQVMEEVARLRRASVLRQYHHLLTTGGRAGTRSGTYLAGGGGGGGGTDGSSHADDHHRGEGPAGARPLEADLDDPLFFFSSVFAWLHQTAALEKGFMRRVMTAGEQTTATAAEAVPLAPTTLTENGLLSTVFSGVCKQLASALEAALLRLSRAATASSAYLADRHAATTSTSSPSKNAVGFQARDAGTGRGPRGLTGQLTRLLFAATGRSMQPQQFVGGEDASWGEDGGRVFSTNAHTAPYVAVHTRDQQEATAAGLLDGVVRTAQTCFSLLMLSEYYSAAVFAPLLGDDAELTVYVGVTAKEAIGAVYADMTTVLVAHWLDSVSAAVIQQAVLRRLASGAAEGGSSNGIHTHFVLEYLVTHHQDATSEDALAAYSGNAEQVARRTALDLTYALRTRILPVSPEMSRCIALLATCTQEHLQQEVVLAAVAKAAHVSDEQQKQEQQEPPPREETAEVVLQQALFLGHALAHFAAFLSTDVTGQATQETKDGETRATSLPPVLANLRDRETYAPLVNALDDACKAVMCVNTYRAAVHALDTALAQGAAAARDGEVTWQEAKEASSGVYARVVALRRDLEKAWHASREDLIVLLAQAAAQHFFPAFLRRMPARGAAMEAGGATASALTSQAHSGQQYGLRSSSAFPPELLARLAEKRVSAESASGQTPSATASASDPHSHQPDAAAQSTSEPRDVKAILAELYDLYNLIASNGTLPPVPLVDAVSDEADRAALSRDLLQRVCEQYKEVYEALEALVSPPSQSEEVGDGQGRLVLQPGEWAAFEDMAPRKLLVLIC